MQTVSFHPADFNAKVKADLKCQVPSLLSPRLNWGKVELLPATYGIGQFAARDPDDGAEDRRCRIWFVVPYWY